ncbi:MAG: hypothetical protein L0Z62_35015 [Gemmataceae bacterium]|nr:hypothetical protein [Gemmataceae bacterium]
MRSSRRLFAVGMVAGSLLLALLFLAVPAEGQLKKQPKGGPLPPPPPKDSGNLATYYSGISLIENDKAQQLLDLAREYINGHRWEPAFQALQNVLSDKNDYYAQVKRIDPTSGEERTRWVSVKFEVNNLIGSMPAAGLEAYEQREGGKARQMLDKAKKTGDRELLADVAQRYMHTKAGIEANDLLATTFLDRGQFFTAALRYERLLALPQSRYKVTDLTLFKAALSYRRAGDGPNADRLWKRLHGRIGNRGLRVGEQVVTTAQLEDLLKRTPIGPPPNPHDWPMPWGNQLRTAQAKGSPPMLDEELWKRKTIQDINDETKDLDRGAEAKAWIDQAVQRSQQMPNFPIMPGFFPIAAGGKLIYRTYNGITAVTLHEVVENGKVVIKPGEVEWKSTEFDGSLAVVLSVPNMRGTLDVWLRQVYHPSGFVNLVYENSTAGTLSTDHRLVFAVDDLAVPAPPRYLAPQFWNSPQVHDEVKPLVKGNSLQAFELDSGRIAFRLPRDSKVHDPVFSESHFLGTPLNIGGKLYVLNEKNDGELRLFCIDPRPSTGPDGKTKWNPVVVPPVQMLGRVHQNHQITHDIARRTSAVHLAYGEGILVCPTNAGQVLGVDLMSRTLAWAYPYRGSPPHPQSVPQNPQLQPPNQQMALTYSNWKVSPPFIADGKVVFAAPDSVAVHAINLRDGSPVWPPIPRQDSDLFLGGIIDGKILIVGKTSARAYSLDKGEHLWTLGTGDLPAGQGVASKNIYYLPLRKGEVLAIDVARGVIHSHNRATRANTPLGNLVFYEGAVLSQTVDEIVAFPQLSAKVDLARKAVEADPTNLTKIAHRGELLLRDGQVQSAIDDLRGVWKKSPEDPKLLARVRQQLYEAYTDLMQVDFKTARAKYLDEYRELCKVEGNPQEQEERQARFLRILGQGLESERDLVGAFAAYREFGSLPLFREKGVPSIEDPAQKVPAHAWLRGRVMSMLSRATKEERLPLEAKIGEEWRVVEAKNDIEAIRSFVGMFDVPFQVGREARLKLAESIIERKDLPAYLEAELSLLQLRVSGLREDAKFGGRALEALARLEISKGKPESMKLAVAYYRDLAREFPKTAIRGTKTGADLFSDVFNDPKRLLPYVHERELLWPRAEFKGRELPPGNIAPGLQGFIFQPTGDMTPFMRQHRLVLDPVNSSNPILRVLDMSTNKVRGDPIPLGNEPANYMFFRHLYDQAERNTAYYPNARFRFYHGKGHLAVFQVGTTVYGLDLSSVKMLWKHNLLDLPGNQPQPGRTQLTPDAEGNLWLLMTDQFGRQTTRTRVGHVGAVQASYVALTSQKGLIVLDPLRGNVMWSKPAVQPQAELFGDDQHIFLVDVGTSGVAGPTQVLRASDGGPVEARNFSHLYRHRLRVQGSKILAADPAGGKLTLRLYDVLTSKDLWKQEFDGKSTVLQTEDDHLAGVIDPTGKITVVDLRTEKTVLNGNVVQGRVTLDDVKNLQKPLLLEDSERFYVALNTPVNNNKVAGGILANNFANGLRCGVVNGWFCCFEKKTGEFLWHLESRTDNQMIILEQFRSLPVLLFSVRYTEMGNRGPGVGGPARNISYTGSADKETGKVIWWPETPRPNNGNAQFYAFTIDMKAGTINMIGYNGTVQHYVDDGRKRPDDNRGAGPVPGPLPKPGGVRPIGDPFGPGGVVPPDRRPPIKGRPGLQPLKKAVPQGANLPMGLQPRLRPVPEAQLPPNFQPNQLPPAQNNVRPLPLKR